MSSRPGILSTVIKPADGGVSPNRYIPQITAEVRVFWPPKATDEEIEAALQEVVDKARAAIVDRRVNGYGPQPHIYDANVVFRSDAP